MKNWQNYKLIVQTSKNSKAIMRYLDKNINSINRVGVLLHIDKISAEEMTEETAEAFRKKKIMRFPALLGPDNAKYIGINDIIELFESKIDMTKAKTRSEYNTYSDSNNGTTGGSGNMLDDFYAREMFNDDKTPKTDAEEDTMNEGGANIERRMAEYERNKPKHHTPGGGEVNINRTRAPREAATPNYNNYGNDNRNDNRASTRPQKNALANNIAHDEYNDYDIDYDNEYNTPVNLPPLSRTDDAAGDDMDQRIADAWMNNL